MQQQRRFHAMTSNELSQKLNLARIIIQFCKLKYPNLRLHSAQAIAKRYF